MLSEGEQVSSPSARAKTGFSSDRYDPLHQLQLTVHEVRLLEVLPWKSAGAPSIRKCRGCRQYYPQKECRFVDNIE